MTKANIIKALVVSAALSFTASSQAESIGFTQLTGNTTDISDQLTLNVSDAGGEVLFSFGNIGPISSSIAQIYFDDAPPGAGNDLGFLGMITMIDGDAGEWRAYQGSPSDLPGGQGAVPPFTTGGDPIQYATASNPAPQNGINVGESLNIYFTYKNAGTINDVISDLLSGALRIGLHVISVGGGDSDSYITGGRETNVPDDGATIALLGLGLIAVGYGSMKIKRLTS